MKVRSIEIKRENSEFVIEARREDDFEPVRAEDVTSIKAELETLFGFCEKLKTDDEVAKEKAEELLEYVTQNTSDKEKLANKHLFKKWEVRRDREEYVEKGEYRVHYDTLYKAKKRNKISYETMPKLNPEIWEEVVSNEGKSKELLVYEEKEKRADFFSRDKSYKKGETTMFYSKLYEALDKVSGEEPDKSSKWKLIEKPSK